MQSDIQHALNTLAGADLSDKAQAIFAIGQILVVIAARLDRVAVALEEATK